MKLYTEEDMKKAFWEGHTYATSIVPASMGWQDRYVQNTIDSFTPIELPSSEEIYNKSKTIEIEGLSWEVRLAHDFFIDGAKWVIEQIKKQDK